MSLKERILQDLNIVIKEEKEVETLVLRQLSAAFLNKEKEKRFKLTKEKPDISEKDLIKENQLTDKEIVEVIFSEAKKRKEAITIYEREKEKDLPSHLLEKIQGLVGKEKKELSILQKYLPEQLSEEEIKKLVKEAIKKVGAQEIKDAGKVMAPIMSQVKGRADGNLVSKVVKELLGAKRTSSSS